jgi:hypothetical protein
MTHPLTPNLGNHVRVRRIKKKKNQPITSGLNERNSYELKDKKGALLGTVTTSIVKEVDKNSYKETIITWKDQNIGEHRYRVQVDNSTRDRVLRPALVKPQANAALFLSSDNSWNDAPPVGPKKPS